MSAEVEPGWYPDPHDAHQARYWSGTGWTDGTRPMDAVVAGGPESTRVPPPWPVLVAGAIGAVAAGVLVAILLTRDGGASDASSEPAAAPAAEAEAEAEAEGSSTTTTAAAGGTTVTTRVSPTTEAAGVASIDQWIVVLASVEKGAPAAEADARHGFVQSRFAEAERLDSDQFESLRPGYLVTFLGPFDTPEATVAFCRSNGLSVPGECYGRFLSHDPADVNLIADG